MESQPCKRNVDRRNAILIADKQSRTARDEGLAGAGRASVAGNGDRSKAGHAIDVGRVGKWCWPQQIAGSKGIANLVGARIDGNRVTRCGGCDGSPDGGVVCGNERNCLVVKSNPRLKR